MRNRINKYIKILLIEFEDIQEDLQFWLDDCKKKRESHEITNYVCWENMALLKNELIGLDVVFKDIEKLDPDKYNNIENLISDLKSQFKEHIHNQNIAEAILHLIDRKIEKVAKYIEEE